MAVVRDKYGNVVSGTPKVAAPKQGASAINAAAREKTAAYQANKAGSTATANNTPSVQGIVGAEPIRQPAYETQAQTQLEQNFAGTQAGLDRTHAAGMQSTNLAAQKAQQDAELQAQQEEQAAAAAASRGEMELAAKLQAQAEQRRLGYVSQISASMQMPQVNDGGANIGEAENQARTAAFARAKERAGQTAASGVKSLQDIMANSGRMGSSMEAGAIGGLLGDSVGDINEFSRDEMIMDLNRAGEISDRNYAGALTQRGQNMQMIPSLLGLIGGKGAY